MNKINVDVLIIGTGVSGLYCALNLREDLKIMIISKTKLTDTNTYLAQGGISTARNKNDMNLFIEDTLKAGKYKNKLEAVNILVQESIENIKNAVNLGMELDKENDEILYTREGAHSINRIVHSKDKTGQVLADTLIKQVKKRNNIVLYENAYLADILKEKNKCCGGIIIKDENQIDIFSKVVVLATGGIGGIFKNSTNRRQLTADGIAIALRNNIVLKNMNYIQFHPTALYIKKDNCKRFLISEAVRGEGGKLTNINGNRFINELLPRDIVAKAINEEIAISGVPYVNLDITFMKKDYIMNRFPTIYSECLKNNIDIAKEFIPVSPAQHYFMGGIDVDLNSQSSMENLFAVGEVSCTGVHGANRLASNSLLEGLVFSKRAANCINKNINNIRIDTCMPKYYIDDVEKIKTENKRIVIKRFKMEDESLNDELFDY